MSSEKKKKSKNKKISLKLSQNELTILLIGAKLLDEMTETIEIDKDLEDNDFEIEDLIDTLSELLPEDIVDFSDQAIDGIVNNFFPETHIIDLDNSDYSYPMYTVKEKLPVIEKAMKQKKIVEIEYYSLEREDVNKREIEPYGMKEKDDLFYLVAYCHWQKDIKIFRVDRIKALKLTNKKFKKPKDFDIEKFNI